MGSVKGRMEEMRQLIEELEEKLNRTSKNSSSPPRLRSTQCRKESSKEKEWSEGRGTTGTQNCLTLKSQHRNVLEFITSSVKATRERQRILDFRFAILDWEEVEQGRTDQSLP